jgi:tetratricopeptide (TPR) repeat protein
MVREICEALEVMTAQAPLLLILEDLHWTDSSTLDLISVLARRRVPAKLLLIGTYRPLDVLLSQTPLRTLKQDLSIRNLCHEIAIERLEESDVAEYLAKVFVESHLPAALAKAIYRHSDGNPLFMAGIVRDMAKRGLIARDRGAWVLTAAVEDVDPGIPETLQQMVDIQFERLSEEEKRVLQCSSVAGERFPVWAPAVMLGSSGELSEEICERLAGREQFLRFVGMQQAADGAESPHYEFRHALYRQALYRGLSESSRAGFHLRLARHLMTFYAAGKRELASEVALHFEKGRDCEQAVHCLIVAAENASRRLALTDSIKILGRALELLPSIRGDARVQLEYEALRRIGDFHSAFGAMSDSVAAYEAAAARAKEAGLEEEHVTTLTAMAFPGFFIDPAKGQQICNLAMQASRNLSDPILRAKTELAVACFRLLYDSWTGNDLEICEQARKILYARTDSISPPYVHDIYIHVLQGEYALAAKQAGILIETAEEPALTLAWGAKGFVYMTIGNFGGMLDLVRKGREAAAKNESPGWMWILGDAWIRQLSFDLEGARNLVNITMPSDAEPHALWLKMVAGVCTGYLESAANNHETALAAFGAVRDFEMTPKSFMHWHWRMQAHLGTVEAYLNAGDLASAIREAASFLESANAISDPKLRALAWEINARVAGADGNWLKAQEYIQHALAIVDKYETLPAGWQVHRTAWKISQVLGDRATAARHRACAEQMIMTIANSFELDEPLREGFLRAPAVRRVLDLAASS